MAPQIERSEPPYIQIAERIRQDIESGVLAEGARVPSAREITATWGVALATATKVQARLRSEGLIQSVPGVGTVVSARHTAVGGHQRLAATHKRGRIYGVGEKAVVRSSVIVEASAEVADAVDLAQGAPVIRRERVIVRDEEPSSSSVSWLPAEHVGQAPRLLTTERIREGTFAYLAAALGLQVTGGREQTSADRATTEQAAALGVEEGSPVLLARTWYYLTDGSPIEYGESAHPAARWITHDFTLS